MQFYRQTNLVKMIFSAKKVSPVVHSIVHNAQATWTNVYHDMSLWCTHSELKAPSDYKKYAKEHQKLKKGSSLQKSLCHGECTGVKSHTAWLVVTRLLPIVLLNVAMQKGCLVSERPWNRLLCQLAYQAAPSAVVYTYF